MTVTCPINCFGDGVSRTSPLTPNAPHHRRSTAARRAAVERSGACGCWATPSMRRGLSTSPHDKDIVFHIPAFAKLEFHDLVDGLYAV